MIARSQRTLWVFAGTLAAALAVALTVPAWAHGPDHSVMSGMGFPGPDRGPILGVPHAPGLLSQLIFPCPAECANTAAECSSGADSTALSCISAACGTEIQTAQTACGASRFSQDCVTAVTALQTCSTSCLTTRQTTLQGCRDALTTCRAACIGPTPTPTP